MFCPRCGNEVEFEADTWFFCNPEAFPTRRKFGFLCYNCHAVIFVREDGLLDVFLLDEKDGLKGRIRNSICRMGEDYNFWRVTKWKGY